eukprot:gene7437-5236_t
MIAASVVAVRRLLPSLIPFVCGGSGVNACVDEASRPTHPKKSDQIDLRTTTNEKTDRSIKKGGVVLLEFFLWCILQGNTTGSTKC